MNYSQKVARAFEIADYILLIPAGFGVFAASLLLKDAAWFAFLIYAVFIFGCVLLVGYFKHSRGRLADKNIRALWIATAVYNGVLVIPAIAMALFAIKDVVARFALPPDWLAFAVNVAAIFGYLTTIYLSVKAYQFEKNQKYL